MRSGIWFSIIASIVLCAPALAYDWSTNPGDGSETNPYQISEPNQLIAIGSNADLLDKHFILMNDIVFDPNNNPEHVFSTALIAPDINPSTTGFQGNPFKGLLDGQEYCIQNLTILSPTTDYIGLIGQVGYKGAVRNQTFIHAKVHGNQYVGVVAGTVDTTVSIKNCHVKSGNVYGGTYVGGIIGDSNCYEIYRSSFQGSVSGNLYVGGLLGWFQSTALNVVSECFTEGTVSGTDYVGGIAGIAYNSMTDSYSCTDITGDEYVGGLVGMLGANRIDTCYHFGTISATQRYNALAGDIHGGSETYNSFYSKDLYGSQPIHCGLGVRSAELHAMEFFSLNNWSGDVWAIDDGNDTPRLAWENRPGVPIIQAVVLLTGSGTEEDPYLIENNDDLSFLMHHRGLWNKHLLLTNDLDVSTLEIAQIGYDKWNFFSGIFDGGGKTISNLTVNSPEKEYGGMFGYLYHNSIVKNLDLESLTVSGKSTVGGVAGYSYGDIVNCKIHGNISASDPLSITGTYQAGGILGSGYWGSLISKCSFQGTVTAQPDGTNVGGITGSTEGLVELCFSEADVNGSDSIGGLVGYNMGTIENCYAKGMVSGEEKTGGLVGYGYASYVNLKNCYFAGQFSGTDLGGIMGYKFGRTDVLNCFWDAQSAGVTTSQGGKGLSSEDMKKYSTYSLNGWGSGVWTILDEQDYPRLTWEHAEGQVILDPNISFAGEGSQNNPYQIESVDDLFVLASGSFYWDKQYRLTSDLDLSQTYLPQIGTVEVNKFTGVFDGGGHIISNYSDISPNKRYTGLLGYLGNDGIIRKTGLENIYIVGDYFAGGLVGFLERGKISQCYVTGYVEGNWYIGGIVGYADFGGSVRDSYSTCTVAGNVGAAGIIGHNYQSDIISCYTSSFCISDTYYEGLAGGSSCGNHNSYFLDGNNTDSHACGSPLTDTEMKQQSNFSYWDFVGESVNGDNEIWRMCVDGVDYPRLSWEFARDGDFACGDGVDINDLQALADAWLTVADISPATFNYAADANSDERIDLGDFTVLGENW